MRDLIDAKTLPLISYNSLQQWQEHSYEMNSLSFSDRLIGGLFGQFFESAPDISLCFSLETEKDSKTDLDINESKSGVHAEYNAQIKLGCWDDYRPLRITVIDIEKNKKYYQSIQKIYTGPDGNLSKTIHESLQQHKSAAPDHQGQIVAKADNFFEFTPDMYSFDLDDDGRNDTPVSLIYEQGEPKYIVTWEEAD